MILSQFFSGLVLDLCTLHRAWSREGPVDELEQWNYDGTRDLAFKMAGLVSINGELGRFVTDYCKPFTPWLIKLSQVVLFPGGKWWQREKEGYPSKIKKVLQDTLKDDNVSKQ